MALESATIRLHNLHNSDGSALFTSPRGTHTLQAAVHYPVEVPYRSEEIPTDTYIEVSLRPHNGVTTVRERHVEEIIRRVLHSVILGDETPRCMLQMTIQIMEAEADEELSGGVKAGGQGEGYLDILVGAVNASILSCLDGGVYMKGLAGAVLVGMTMDGQLAISPKVKTRKQCASLHAFGFNSKGHCIMMESVGSFTLVDWETAEKAARDVVCGSPQERNGVEGNVGMKGSDEDSTPSILDQMRRSVEERVARDERWKL